MGKRNRAPEGRGTGKRRASRPLVAAAILFAFLFVFCSVIKIHETFLLVEAAGGWNQKQLARFNHDRTDFKFAVFADTHNSTRTFNLIRNEIEKGDYLFAMDIGDMSIDSGRVKMRLFLNQVSSMKTPVLTAVGNHDIAAGGYRNYLEVYGPRYYSFTVGKALFIVLDDAQEEKIDDEQMAWFESELRRGTEYPNIFVFMHVPPFRGRRDLNLPMQKFLEDRENAERFKQLCIAYEVDVVFCGHCHTFDYDIWPNDVHYVITGGGGGRLWDVERSRSLYHYFSVTVEGSEGMFELEPVRGKWLHFWYQNFEQPWAYLYAYVCGRYYFLGPLLLAGCAAFLFPAVFRKRRKPAAAAEDPSPPGE